MLYAAVPRLFYCIATHQHARETQRVPKFKAVHLATLYFLRIIGRWLIKVPNEAVNGLLQENILFLLMLLRRILCLQSREDSRFFAFFLPFYCFFKFPGIVRDSPNSFSAQLPDRTCGRTTLQICLLTVNALCSEGKSNSESQVCSFIPPQNWGQDSKRLNRNSLLVSCSEVECFAPSASELLGQLSTVGRVGLW